MLLRRDWKPRFLWEMMIVHDKLLFVHKLLNEITNAESEDALSHLFESYRDRLGTESEEEVIRQLFEDAQMLGKEILFLRESVNDAYRNRNLAKLTTEERAELAEVEAIIDENRFHYHFQPIVSALDGSIYAYEALMRPQSDMRLSPFHILKYSELVGRLYDIEYATFWNVLNMIDSEKPRFKGRKVFINSLPEVSLKGNDTKRVGELLLKHSDTAVVELIEQADSKDVDLSAFKERFVKRGLEFAIDDFGTGYSNIRNLLRYAPDYVKIDRSLISNIQGNQKKLHFVREVIDFCHSSGIKVLAEGVETSDELHAVILMGVELIQGYYTAKPDAEVIDSIPHKISEEIKLCQQERQAGRKQLAYAIEAGGRIQLDRLANDGYNRVLIEKTDSNGEEVTIIGSPSFDAEMYIEIADNYTGRILLENVHLSDARNRACISLGEHSDVTLSFKGENRLDKGGIQVPEGAKLALEGDGTLDIQLDASEYFGIGNDLTSRHGDLVFNQTGIVSIHASGKTGVCIGSGLGGNIAIGHPGKFDLSIRGNTGVGIGALHADTKLDIGNCAFDANLSIMRGVAIGSLTGSADVRIDRSSANLHMSGKEIVAVGTISGDSADILVSDAIVTVNTTGYRCTCVGALEKSTSFKAQNASFQATATGEEALPFGGLRGEASVSLNNVDATVKMESNADLEKYISEANIQIIDGRIDFTNHGVKLI